MAAMFVCLCAVLAISAAMFFTAWIAVRLKGCKISLKKFFIFLDKNY